MDQFIIRIIIAILLTEDNINKAINSEMKKMKEKRILKWDILKKLRAIDIGGWIDLHSAEIVHLSFI